MEQRALTTIASMSKDTKTQRMSAADKACAARLKQHWDRAKAEGRVQSQEHVAHQLGVTQGAIWQMLHGRVPVSLMSAIVLARILECDPREISVAAQETYRKLEDFSASSTSKQPTALVFNPSGHVAEDVQGLYMSAESRYVPLLTTEEVARGRTIQQGVREDASRDWVGVTEALAPSLGSNAFALEIEGDAMKQELKAGDVVIIDPAAEVRPGDLVVARVSDPAVTVVRKFRDRGTDQDGHPVFELAPLNDDYPVIVVDQRNPGEIVGPIVEYRRRLR